MFQSSLNYRTLDSILKFLMSQQNKDSRQRLFISLWTIEYTEFLKYMHLLDLYQPRSLSLIFHISFFTDFEILSGNISNFQILLKYVNFTARQFGKIRSDLSISLLSNKARDFSLKALNQRWIYFSRISCLEYWDCSPSPRSPLSVRVILP